MLNIQALIDDATGYETVRSRRGPDGVRGPDCDSAEVVTKGRDDCPPDRQRSECRACPRRLDDRTDPILAGPHRPLRAGLLGLDLRGRNLSNERSAKELDLDPDDTRRITSLLREGVVQRRPAVVPSGAVEGDAASVVAGPKGPPEAVEKEGGSDDAAG